MQVQRENKQFDGLNRHTANNTRANLPAVQQGASCRAAFSACEAANLFLLDATDAQHPLASSRVYSRAHSMPCAMANTRVSESFGPSLAQPTLPAQCCRVACSTVCQLVQSRRDRCVTLPFYPFCSDLMHDWARLRSTELAVDRRTKAWAPVAHPVQFGPVDRFVIRRC